MKRIPLALLLLSGITATASGQNSGDLDARFHVVISYEVRPGIVMTPKYASDGQVCEMVIEKHHKTDSGHKFRRFAVERSDQRAC
jgi:hypothetical protein